MQNITMIFFNSIIELKKMKDLINNNLFNLKQLEGYYTFIKQVYICQNPN